MISRHPVVFIQCQDFLISRTLFHARSIKKHTSEPKGMSCRVYGSVKSVWVGTTS